MSKDMTVQERFDFTTLNWVKQELDVTLKQVRDTLEIVVENPSDVALMRECVQGLHQVHGTLRMVELYGAAMIAEEMERVASALVDDRIRQREEAFAILMRGLVQMPDYLERLQSGHKDIPIVLLPLLNDLRACRGEKFLTESVLFSPDLTLALPQNIKGTADTTTDAEIRSLAKQLRSTFQMNLLHWFRKHDTDTAINNLINTLEQLHSLCTQDNACRLWWIAAGVLDAIALGKTDPGAALKVLFGRVDREIKRLVEGGDLAFHSGTPQDLLRNLLYYVAYTQVSSPRIEQIKQVYNLEQLLPTDKEIEHAKGTLAGKNRTLLDTVSVAIKEDLLRVKDALDIYLRAQQDNPQTLSEYGEILDRIADTLGMLGLGMPRRVVQNQSQALAEMAASQRPVSENELLDVASALLYVDASLDENIASLGNASSSHFDDSGKIPHTEVERILEVLLKEAIANLQQVKQEVVSFVESPWDHQKIVNTPRLLEEIVGALRMLNLEESAQVLYALKYFIDAELVHRHRIPNATQMDQLADALASFEYYLEAVAEHRGSQNKILELTKQNLELLGYWPIPENFKDIAQINNEAKESIVTSLHNQNIDNETENYKLINENSADFSISMSEEQSESSLDYIGEDKQELSIAETIEDQFANSEVEGDWVDVEEEVADFELSDSVATYQVGFQNLASEDIDAEIREIFVEELKEEIINIQQQLPLWQANVMDIDLLKPIRRSYHTLKGSGRLVGALVLGEFSWKIENLLNRVLDNTVPHLTAVSELMGQALQALGELLSVLEGRGSVQIDLAQIMSVADQLAAGEEAYVKNVTIEPIQQKKKVLRRIYVPRVLQEKTLDQQQPLNDESATENTAVLVFPSADNIVLESTDFSANDTSSIYHIDTDNITAQNEETVPELPSNPDDCIQLEDNTLEDDVLVNAPVMPIFDAVLLEALQVEADTHLYHLQDYLKGCDDQGEPQLISETLLRSMHTLHGAMAMAAVPVIEDVLGLLEAYMKRLRGVRESPGIVGLEAICMAYDCCREVANNLGNPGVNLPTVDAVLQALHEVCITLPEPEDPFHAFALDMDDVDPASLKDILNQDIALEDDVVLTGTDQLLPEVVVNKDVDQEAFDPLMQNKTIVTEHATQGKQQLDLSGVDADLIDIFLEEGQDILNQVDALIAKLRQVPTAQETIAALQRHLHTLKGNARAVSIPVIADLCHAIESLLESVVAEQVDVTHEVIEILERSFDQMHHMFECVIQRQIIPTPTQLITQIFALAEVSDDTIEHAVSADTEAIGHVAYVPDAQFVQAKSTAKIQDGLPQPTLFEDLQRSSQEVVRVRSDLLDTLVNFAGEVSIYRSRLEQQMGSFRFNLVELDQTVLRLREQLRKLEIETEVQILSRYQRETISGEVDGAFDPLELDRYSTIQQLSRALAESVSDLHSLQGALDDLTRQSETLLLQQSRVSSDLQEGLMHTRMIPFESITPFLRRLVRQTADELGKKTNLFIEGAQGEMDRTLLERMKAPLEHMLRNAIAHGIEKPEVRVRLGKEDGRITVAVSREATEVVLKISDDGQGLDRDAIRQKAIDRGLMHVEAQLPDRDLFAFILETGFSTAAHVTQVSGRGVGMDVVANEIKQMGGSLAIDSKAGEGTQFTVRLPFTLAMTQAILIRLGDHIYAIPMSSVHGVARAAQQHFGRRLSQVQSLFNYAGEDYFVYELTKLLTGQSVSHHSGDDQRPLLLVRSGDFRAAISVDSVIGSREIVVKPIGPQISSVPGILGATIMGDGTVVMILDLAPLIRHYSAAHEHETMEHALYEAIPGWITDEQLVRDEHITEPQQQRLLVMVVDDSITMRKVTTRVLERNDIEVITAKDGLDAVEKLQERAPDLILLDIEMPRMDGYELATYVRNDSRLRAIPIIMITSRTGEKHRQRAFEIGVDRFLGKPYQEIDLLRQITETLQLTRTLH